MQGSTVLYLNKIISRKPNDLDVLLDSNINLQQKNKYVNSFLSNFEIINFSKKTELIKKCKIKFNSQEFKLEFILEKNIDSKFITDSSRLRTTNSLYFLPSKFTQLAYIIGVDFANEIKKRRKINQILSDMVEIIQKIDYDNKLVGYILDNIKSNLCYQIISLKKHYYNNLLSLNNYLRRNNYFVNSRLSILFKNLSLNVGLNKFLNILDKIFIIKNDFFYYVISSLKKPSFKKKLNCGTIFFLKNNTQNINAIFIFLKRLNENFINKENNFYIYKENKIVFNIMLPILEKINSILEKIKEENKWY